MRLYQKLYRRLYRKLSTHSDPLDSPKNRVLHPAAMPEDQAQESPALLQRLQELAGTLSSHEVPAATEIPAVVGALVKVLGHDGTEVSDDLFPKSDDPAARVAQLEAQLAELRSEQGPVPDSGANL